MTETAIRCPWCNATDPTKPPRMRFGGLVPCRNSWHGESQPEPRYDPWNDLRVVDDEGMPQRLQVCNDCGSAVANTDRHDAWHSGS